MKAGGKEAPVRNRRTTGDMAFIERENRCRCRFPPVPEPERVVVASQGEPAAFSTYGAADSPPIVAGEDTGSLPGRDIHENGMSLVVEDQELRFRGAERQGSDRAAVS